VDLLTTPDAQLVRPWLSVVVPVYNEEAALVRFHERLGAVMCLLESEFRVEIVYINDGSVDDSMAQLEQLHAADARVVVDELSRNFGKEVALSAGFDLVQRILPSRDVPPSLVAVSESCQRI
jgi:glycosyltransferase involved in cell wall biosynthesis